MTTTVEFYGGLREIGASKILICTDQARVLLDIGLPIGEGSDLFDPPVEERPGHELADRLQVGQAPQLPGFWDPAQLPEGSPLADRDHRPSAVFVSHAHIDHIGMAGLLDPAITIWASPVTVQIVDALTLAGQRFIGHQPVLHAIEEPVQIGDITVEAIPVDHDVPGATGYLVTTPDGRLAYTGDINFHRDDCANSHEFARRIEGVDMLVTETTSLSFDPPEASSTDAADASDQAQPTDDAPMPSEAQVLATIEEAVTAAPGLALVSLYERDVERCAALIAHASEWGRRVIWPGATAAFLAAMGVPDVATWDATRPQRVGHMTAVKTARAHGFQLAEISLDEVTAHPADYIVQLDHLDMPAMLDLALNSHVPWIHSQGEPLGPFMPEWQVFQRWLSLFDIQTVHAGSSGHATVAALTDFVHQVSPGVAVPLHGFHPERLDYSGDVLLPEYGSVYGVDGRQLSD